MPDTVDKTDSDWQYWSLRRQGIMKLRSLFVTVAGAFLLTAAFLPRADAIVISYFNFEDSIVQKAPPFNFLDVVPDTVQAGNPGGGQANASTTMLTINDASNVSAINVNAFAVTPGLSINATANDSDTPSNFALVFNNSKNFPGEYIQFSVNTQFYAGLSLSFGQSSNGNGFASVTLSYSINGGAFITTGVVGSVSGTATEMLLTGTQPPVSFSLPAAVNGDGMTANSVTFRLTFNGGFSNGVDNQTIIDNIRLDATTVVPEPATVAGGLFGVLGLCWLQRRRLIRFTRLRQA